MQHIQKFSHPSLAPPDPNIPQFSNFLPHNLHPTPSILYFNFQSPEQPPNKAHSFHLYCAATLPSSGTPHGSSPTAKLSSGPGPSSPLPLASPPIDPGGQQDSVAVRAELNTFVVISLITGLSLFLGGFALFNFQRENVAKQVPEQNVVTHFEAADTRAKEYVGLLKSNDTVGFNIVDVLPWVSVRHIVAYYILATSSNVYDPSFFG